MMDDIILTEIIASIGWKRLIKGLARYAQKKEKYHRELELNLSAHQWHIIVEKLMGIRKEPQL